MYVHEPPNVQKGAAVVVAMHGCTQNAAAYVSAGWNDIADKQGFVVVYPEQSSANNSTQCFRWYDPAHTTRDKGEAKAIAAMVTNAKTKYGSTKAYVTGLSAGGAMTSVMLATYPDLFEAGAVFSGIAYDCATSQLDAYSCMNPGKDKTPEQWAALVPKTANPPRVSIWHGSSDYTVAPKNAEESVRQWLGVNGIDESNPTTETVGKATHTIYGGGKVESWIVQGMGHGTPVAPKSSCGTAGAYILDEDLCSSQKAAEFFGLAPSAFPSGTSSSSSGASSGTGSSTSPTDPSDCN